MITYKKLEIGEKAHPVDFGWAFSATERGNFNEHRKRVCSEMKDITKHYGENTVLNGVSLSVKKVRSMHF